MVPLFLLACSPEFSESRKDLDGFRLVAMGFADADLRGAVWSGEGAWHTTAPSLAWTTGGEAVTEASAPPFTVDLQVEAADGATEAGRLVVQADATVPIVEGFTREVTGSSAAISLSVSEGSFTRWMGTSGTFTETGPHAADWVPDGSEGATLLALTLDGRGGETWTWVDVEVEPEGQVLEVGGRLLPTDGSGTGSGWFLATIEAEDSRHGVRLTTLEPTADGSAGETVCGLDPFDLDALADGRCGRDAAAGARVALFGAIVDAGGAP